MTIKQINSQKRILLISRGKGMGHATRDIGIVKELQKIAPNITVNIATYGMGYKAFTRNGYTVTDLGFPEALNWDEALNEKFVKIGSMIIKIKPDLIIGDEELAPMTLARLFEIPSVLITDWLPPEDIEWNVQDFFSDANVIIFPDIEGSFQIPRNLRHIVRFTGPIVRRSQYSLKDRNLMRTKLGIGQEKIFILVTAGGVRDIDEFFFISSIKAFKKAGLSHGELFLLAGPLSQKLAGFADESIVIRDFVSEIDMYIVASDIVITRGGHTTLWELAFMGVPSISIPRLKKFDSSNLGYAQNMANRGTTKLIREEYLTDSVLAEVIRTILESDQEYTTMSQAVLKLSRINGAEEAARVVCELLEINNVAGSL